MSVLLLNYMFQQFKFIQHVLIIVCFLLYDAQIKVSEASLHNLKYCKTHVEIPQNPHLLNHRYTFLILHLQSTKGLIVAQ